MDCRYHDTTLHADGLLAFAFTGHQTLDTQGSRLAARPMMHLVTARTAYRAFRRHVQPKVTH